MAVPFYVPEHSPEPDLSRLHDDIRLTSRVSTHRVHAAPAAVARNTQQLRLAARHWIPVARERRAAAAGSTADQDRWDTLVSNADPDGLAKTSFTDLIVLAGAVRDLLQALHDTMPPCPTAHQVAQQITDAIAHERYPVGCRMSIAEVAADLTVSVELVELAAADLVGTGVLERSGRRLTAAGRADVQRERAGYVAERLRAQIAAGVYPPGTLLPTLTEMARTFVSDLAPVVGGLRLLAAAGLVLIRHGKRSKILEPARCLPAPDHPTPRPYENTRAFGYEEVLAASRTAREQWRRRIRVAPDLVHGQWEELRAMARQILALPPGPDLDARQCRDTRQGRDLARAVELENAPLPEPLWLRLWHTACLAAAVAALLPPAKDRLTTDRALARNVSPKTPTVPEPTRRAPTPGGH